MRIIYAFVLLSALLIGGVAPSSQPSTPCTEVHQPFDVRSLSFWINNCAKLFELQLLFM
jgi:hypothetical protein